MNGIPTTNITMIKIDPTNSIPTLSTTNPGFNGRNNNTNPNNLFQIRQTTIINSMSREI